MEDRLFIRQGAVVTDAHLRALDAAIARATPRPSAGTRLTITPDGYHRSYSGAPGGASSPVFRPAVSLVNGGALVRWSGPRALIGGVVPTIGDVEIFATDPATKARPHLEVTAADVNEHGECGIYFRVEVDRADDFRVRAVLPVASAQLPPPKEPGIAYCLALFLRTRGGRLTYVEDDDRELFSNQGFFAANRRTDGTFEPLFWARF